MQRFKKSKKFSMLYSAINAQFFSFVLNTSSLYRMIEQDRLKVPEPSCLPDSHILFPYFTIGDGIFGLKKWLLKPYPGTGLTEEEQYFNFRYLKGVGLLARREILGYREREVQLSVFLGC